MIASLRGIVRSHDVRSIVVDVGGVGFRVFVGTSLLESKIDETIQLFTYLHVNSDAMELYGFTSEDELGLFQSLLKVSGVGPRSALALISGASASELRQAIMSADTGPLVRIPGIGKKTAERIILELSGTLVKAGGPTSDDAIDALERLGYSRKEAAEALRHVDSSGDVRDRIRAALKMLSSRP